MREPRWQLRVRSPEPRSIQERKNHLNIYQVQRLLILDHPRLPVFLTSAFCPAALTLRKSEALIRKEEDSMRKEKSSQLYLLCRTDCTLPAQRGTRCRRAEASSLKFSFITWNYIFNTWIEIIFVTWNDVAHILPESNWRSNGIWQGEWPPKDVRILIPTSCESISLSGRRDFVDSIKLKILIWGDYPGVSRLAQCHPKGPYKREVGGSQTQEAMWLRKQRDREREIRRCHTAGFEDRAWDQEPRN